MELDNIKWTYSEFWFIESLDFISNPIVNNVNDNEYRRWSTNSTYLIFIAGDRQLHNKQTLLFWFEANNE